MTKPFLLHHAMAYSLLALGGWYALGLMSLPACDKRLRRLLLLFPMLFGVTFLFGQFNKPRQFNAFIPVLIAVLLSAFRRMLDLEQGAVRRASARPIKLTGCGSQSGSPQKTSRATAAMMNLVGR